MRSKFGLNAQIEKPVSVMTDSGTRINRLELTRDLCDLETFVMSPSAGRKFAHDSQNFAQTTDDVHFAQSPRPARKIDFSERGFLTAEYPDLEPELQPSVRSESRASFSGAPSASPTRPSFSFEDRISMARLLQNEASEVTFEAREKPSRPAKKAAPKPANPFFDTRVERPPMPSWMWTLLSFGGCGTACGTVIYVQKLVGMPISPTILNLGLSVFVSGCAMFALAVGLALTRKNKLAF